MPKGWVFDEVMLHSALNQYVQRLSAEDDSRNDLGFALHAAITQFLLAPEAERLRVPEQPAPPVSGSSTSVVR